MVAQRGGSARIGEGEESSAMPATALAEPERPQHDSTSSRRCVSGNSDTHAAVCAYGGPEEVGLAHPKGLTSR